MDHVVYVDAKEKELENLLSGTQSMIIRGAAGRKLPYGRVGVGDTLWLINNNAEGLVKAKATVSKVVNSPKMTKEESIAFVEEYQGKLQLSAKRFKRWAGKRYIVVIAVEDVKEITPFPIDKSEYGNMDDWLLVGEISNVQ